MAYSLSGERPQAAAVSLNPFRAVARWVANARAARAQKLALGSLLEFETHRLDDLGINRQDLFDAMHRDPSDAGRLLAARRARTARPTR